MTSTDSATRPELQPAWLLHRRAWRDSSQIIEVLSCDFGRVGLVARGVRRANARLRGVLEPFQPLLLSWTGRGELQTLTAAERQQNLPRLHGDALLAGFYLNELLLRLLARHDPHPGLFARYGEAVGLLADGGRIDVPVRRFEWGLLDETGVAPDPEHEAGSGAPVRAEQWYRVAPEAGVYPLDGPASGALDVPGAVLLAIAGDNLENMDEALLGHARRLLRRLLEVRLGGYPLKTRQVMMAMRRNHGEKFPVEDP